MIDMKFNMCFKNIERIYNSMVMFSKYVAMLIFLVRVVALCYNLVCSQTLSLNFNFLNILGPYQKKKKKKVSILFY